MIYIGEKRKRREGGHIGGDCFGEEGKRGAFWDCGRIFALRKSTQQPEESDCSKRLSRYAPCYSQCSYPYSISPLGRLFVFFLYC